MRTTLIPEILILSTLLLPLLQQLQPEEISGALQCTLDPSNIRGIWCTFTVQRNHQLPTIVVQFGGFESSVDSSSSQREGLFHCISCLIILCPDWFNSYIRWYIILPPHHHAFLPSPPPPPTTSPDRRLDWTGRDD